MTSVSSIEPTSEECKLLDVSLNLMTPTANKPNKPSAIITQTKEKPASFLFNIFIG